MRLECTSLTAHRSSLPSPVRCSVMSVNHSRLGAAAVKTRLTWSSWIGGPGRPPLPRRGLPNALHQWLAEQIAQAVRPVIGCPFAAASSTRSR